MSAAKTVRVFFKGSEQHFQIYDYTSEEKLVSVICKLYNVKTNPRNVFLTNANGDFLVLPSIIPDGLCIHVRIDDKFLQLKKDLPPGFKWVFRNSPGAVSWCFGQSQAVPSISNHGATYDYVPFSKSCQFDVWSSQVYSKGTLCCRFDVTLGETPLFLGVVSEHYSGTAIVQKVDCPSASVINITDFCRTPQSTRERTVYLVLDMNEYMLDFFDVIDGEVMRRVEIEVLCEHVRVYAYMNGAGPLSIFNGGSIAVPDFLCT